MKRKVARIGPATLMISLPSKWVKKHAIKKGDELELTEEGNQINISTNQTSIVKGELNLQIDQRFLKLFLNRMYRAGYDEVKIIFNKKPNTKVLSEELKYLMGFEIVSMSDKSCVIKNVTVTNENEFDPLFNRLFLVVHSLLREGNEAIESDSLNDDNLIPIEDTINKLSNLCERILNKYGYSDKNKITLLLQQTELLEQIGDSFYRLYGTILENKIKLDKSFLKLLHDIEIYFMEIYKLFNNFQQATLEKMYKTRKDLYTLLKTMLKEGKGKELLALSELNVVFNLLRDLDVSIVGF